MLDPKKQLDITLPEPIIFLRTPDPSGRLQSDPSDPPTLVRGILTLNVVKPIGISSIEAELTGVLAICFPEDLPEKHKIYSSTVTVFRADQVPRGRHSTSIGPGLSSANSNEDERTATTASRLPSLPRGRSERRGIVCAPLDPGPTPPYTAAQSPPIQSRLGVPGDHPTRALEELRQSLRENLEAQEGFIPPSSRSSIASSLPNPMMHSNASSTSNDSLHRENDSHTDDLVHTQMSSPLEGDTSFHNTTEDLPHILPHQGPSPSRPPRAYSPENTNGPQRSPHGGSLEASNTPASHSRLRLSFNSVLDAVREITSRAPSRSRNIPELEERERGRSRVRIIPEEQSRASIQFGEDVSPGSGSQLGSNTSHSASGHTEHREHHLLGLGRVLGLERDHERDNGDERKSRERGEGWREFKPGTYSYPISFLLPPHLPPTFSLPNGSLDYAIRGVAHRPGTFTAKLSCQVPLLVVASPAIGTGEGSAAGDPGPLFVQKQWRAKLAYSIGLSSRLFILGSERHLGAAANESVCTNTGSLVEVGVETVYGTATLDLTLLPIEKTKIWKLGLAVDQHIRYVDERGRLFRDDDKRQVKLLEVQDTCSAEEMDLMDEEHTHKNKHKDKHDPTRIPLLPTPISPHRSPLLRYLPPSTDPSTLAGPGPYTLSINMGLPGCSDTSGGDNGLLHFTMKHKSSSVKVEHFLRLVMRVESVGEEDTNDNEEGEERLFDIAVKTPITILSCRCIPEYQMLPRYSKITEDSLQNRAGCPCQPSTSGPTEQGHGHDVGSYLGHVMTPSPASSFDNVNRAASEQHGGHERSRSPSPAGRSGHANSLPGLLHLHLPSPASWAREAGWNRSPSDAQTHSHAQHHSHSLSYSVSTSHVRTHSAQTPPFSTPHPSRPPSPLAQYERLVSGLESEAGEAPPSYDSVTSGP